MKKLTGYLSEDASNRPLVMLIAMLLLAAAGTVFPLSWLYPVFNELTAAALVRTVFGLVGILLMIMFGFHAQLKLQKRALPALDVFLVLLVLVVNNFPFIPHFFGDATYPAAAPRVLSYVWFCLSVGLFEEIFFRGLIFPLCLQYFKSRKYGLLYSVLLSAALFGLIHLVNLIGNIKAFPAVALQIAYSAAFGAGYAFLTYLSKSVWPAVLLHAVFDIGGLLTDYDIIKTSNLWPTAAVVLTAVLGVLIAGYLVFRFVKYLRKNPYLPLDKSDEKTATPTTEAHDEDI